VHAKENGGFYGEFGINVDFVGFVVEFGRVGGFESLGKIAIGEEFGFDEHLKISVVGSSVPGVSDMASVHNFSEDVFQIIVGDLVVFGQVIV